MVTVIKTRKEFLDVLAILESANFQSPSVDFRDVCYVYRTKVKSVIQDRMNAVFPQTDDINTQIQNWRFSLCMQFAEKDNEGNPIIAQNPDGTSSYNISPENRAAADKMVADEFEKTWREKLDEWNKASAEKTEWLEKQVKLDIEQVQRRKDIPMMDDSSAYEPLVKMLCAEQVETTETDGEEVQ